METKRIKLLIVLTVGCLMTLSGTAMSPNGLSVSIELGTILFTLGSLIIACIIVEIGKKDSLIFGNPDPDTSQHIADKKWSARFYYGIGAIMVIITIAITGIEAINLAPGLALVVLGLIKRNVQIGVKVHREYHIRLFNEAFEQAMAKHQVMI